MKALSTEDSHIKITAACSEFSRQRNRSSDWREVQQHSPTIWPERILSEDHRPVRAPIQELHAVTHAALLLADWVASHLEPWPYTLFPFISLTLALHC
jgi:hypothetical protein